MQRTLAIAVCGSLFMVACATFSEETVHSPTTTPLAAPSTVPDVTVPTATTVTMTADFSIDYESLEAFKESTTSTTVPDEPSVPSAASASLLLDPRARNPS